MADDEEVLEPDDFEVEEEEPEPAELDEDELDDAELDEVVLGGDDDDEFVVLGDEFGEGEDETEQTDSDGPVRRSVPSDEDDDDDDMVTPDDVEADLDTILKDRLIAADDEGNDDDEPEEKGEAADRLQPKRPDEQLCPSCFLLVRHNAPGCPVGDDECPLFRQK